MLPPHLLFGAAPATSVPPQAPHDTCRFHLGSVLTCAALRVTIHPLRKAQEEEDFLCWLHVEMNIFRILADITN